MRHTRSLIDLKILRFILTYNIAEQIEFSLLGLLFSRRFMLLLYSKIHIEESDQHTISLI